jgi:hypothetical protein
MPQPQEVPPGQAFAQVNGVHAGLPHTLAVPPPPHVSEPLHVPQLKVPPQPSPTLPQLIAVPPVPALEQVSGTQGAPPSLSPQTLGLPPPPHV